MAHSTDKKQKLSDISFEKEGSHVALVGQHQGGPANGVETLVFKTANTKNITDQDLVEVSKEANVSVTMTFTEFLVRWFDLWWDQADVLATLLGMEEDILNEPGMEDYKEMIQEKVDDIDLMKSAEKSMNDGGLQDFINNLSDEQYASLRKAKRMFEQAVEKAKPASPQTESSSGEAEDGEAEGASEGREKSSGEPKDDNSTKGNEMTEEELNAKIEKARQEGQAELQEELQKAKDELESLRKEREDRTRQEYQTLVKSFSFVEETEQEGIVKALMASEGSEGHDALLKAFEKAQKAVAEATGVKGHDGEEVDEADLEKSRERISKHIQDRNKKKQ